MKSKSGLKRMGMTKGNELTFLDLQKEFLKKCQICNLSEYTIKTYQNSCRLFNKFVNLGELRVMEINRSLINDYILHLKSTGIKDITINTYVRNVSPIIKYGMSLEKGSN